MRRAVVLAALSLAGMTAAAQQVPDIGFVSVGRAAPLEHDVNQYELTGGPQASWRCATPRRYGRNAPPFTWIVWPVR
jgi:hypothetical protein